MHDIVGQAWASARTEHEPIASTQLSSERDWTSQSQHITQKVHTCTTQERESGLAKACCTQSGPAHAAGHLEMAWTGKSTLLTCTTGSPHRCSQTRSESNDRNHESGNNDKRHWHSNLYRSRYRIGKSMSGRCPCCRGGRPFMVHIDVLDSSILKPFLN